MPTRGILAVLIAIVLSAALTGSVAAGQPPPRVAVIVGPAGELTGLYRSIGNAAAQEARRWTTDVVTVMTPNATWPIVKRALRGASVVVYLGHGNGFPSPYRDALYRPTQDGLGLNPVAGGDDTAHQYFGEAFLASQVRLAPGAVVLLHHLCYASGNSEPGLPEGSLDVARQRVDDYAAGWLAAGAGAVIADTFGAPVPYLKALLGTNQTVDRLWRGSPDSHDHVLAFPSARTPGYQVAMDPTRVGSGFNRSLVARPGLTAAAMRDGAGRVSTLPIRSVGAGDGPIGSLAALGATFRAPALDPATAGLHSLVAGSRATLSLPIGMPTGASVPRDLQLGVRWDPIAVDPSPSPNQPADPTPTDPATQPPTAPAIDPPAVDPVVPEVLGSIVTTARARLIKGRLRVGVELPLVAGTYRLVTTVHDADGVAFDAATEILVPALTVRVSRSLSATYGIVPSLHLPAGAAAILPVRVVNDGSLAWADPVALPEALIEAAVVRAHPSAWLVGRWVPLTADRDADGLPNPTVPIIAAPGSEITVLLPLTAPTAPGAYLLVLDVDSPLQGSLAAHGVPPGQVRVTVDPASMSAPERPATPFSAISPAAP